MDVNSIQVCIIFFDDGRAWNLQLFWLPFLPSLTLTIFEGSMQFVRSITTLESFHLKATIPSLLTRKALSSRSNNLSEVNDAPKTSSFVFFFFFDLSSAVFFFASAAAFFFAGVSIFSNSFQFCLTTPIPYNEFSVNFLVSDGEVKKLSKKIRLNLPFNFSVS